MVPYLERVRSYPIIKKEPKLSLIVSILWATAIFQGQYWPDFFFFSPASATNVAI